MARELCEPEVKSDLSLKLAICVLSPSGLFEERANLFDERVRIEGLGHVQVGADLFASEPVEFLPLGGEQDDPCLDLLPLIFDDMADIESVLLGHHDIEHDDIGLVFTNGLESFFAIGGSEEFGAFVFEVFKGLLDQHSQVGFVIDYENLHCFHL